MINKNTNQAFTLIELLVVIAIIGLLSSIVIASLNSARKKARDARRIADIKEIQKALDMYYDDYGRYPNPSSDSCFGGWDTGPCNDDNTFINELKQGGYLSEVPVDPLGYDNHKYFYYRYVGWPSNGCDPEKGAYYVLAVKDMETSNGPHPKSPGFKCSNRDWQDEFEYVVGKYEGF